MKILALFFTIVLSLSVHAQSSGSSKKLSRTSLFPFFLSYGSLDLNAGQLNLIIGSVGGKIKTVEVYGDIKFLGYNLPKVHELITMKKIEDGYYLTFGPEANDVSLRIKFRNFTENGGIILIEYWQGIVNKSGEKVFTNEAILVSKDKENWIAAKQYKEIARSIKSVNINLRGVTSIYAKSVEINY